MHVFDCISHLKLSNKLKRIKMNGFEEELSIEIESNWNCESLASTEAGAQTNIR